jgi:hypothetical protein
MAEAAKYPEKKKVVVFLTLGTKMHKYIHIYSESQKTKGLLSFPEPAFDRERQRERGKH